MTFWPAPAVNAPPRKSPLSSTIAPSPRMIRLDRPPAMLARRLSSSSRRRSGCCLRARWRGFAGAARRSSRLASSAEPRRRNAASSGSTSTSSGVTGDASAPAWRSSSSVSSEVRVIRRSQIGEQAAAESHRRGRPRPRAFRPRAVTESLSKRWGVGRRYERLAWTGEALPEQYRSDGANASSLS